AMVSDSNDGIVSECVEVTVHGAGVAAVEAIEQDCAALDRATAAVRTATTNNLRMRVGSGLGRRHRHTCNAAQQAAAPSTSINAAPGGGSSVAALN
ncbi:MAG TPA: hypothetical protein VGP95_07315, partial [Gemmatimonadaceae bacterium]|nr:hypothetical protein [Gemmatimonadaceae bacterium]